MKLMTLNTHSWQEEKQLEKLDVVAQAIIEQGCDVVALQEVNQHQNSPAVDANILTNHTVLADNYGYLLQKNSWNTAITTNLHGISFIKVMTYIKRDWHS
jgi:maltose 6'-phosphate phosphatase